MIEDSQIVSYHLLIATLILIIFHSVFFFHDYLVLFCSEKQLDDCVIISMSSSPFINKSQSKILNTKLLFYRRL